MTGSQFWYFEHLPISISANIFLSFISLILSWFSLSERTSGAALVIFSCWDWNLKIRGCVGAKWENRGLSQKCLKIVTKWAHFWYKTTKNYLSHKKLNKNDSLVLIFGCVCCGTPIFSNNNFSSKIVSNFLQILQKSIGQRWLYGHTYIEDQNYFFGQFSSLGFLSWTPLRLNPLFNCCVFWRPTKDGQVSFVMIQIKTFILSGLTRIGLELSKAGEEVCTFQRTGVWNFPL